ncbi:MAG: TfpX/TfpZ family type IV pilin accessory protein [Spongiibacteraceae bacterium]
MGTTINWRERFVAAGLHLLATAAVAAIVGLLIFAVWFPGPLAEMAGGRKLFFLVVSIDIALGPLISLAIFNSKKSRGKLIFDYAVVSALQLTALIYGASMISISRPLFIVFTVDRLEVVASLEIEEKDLAAATIPEFRKRHLFGPKLAAVEFPHDAEANNQLMFSAVNGKDIQMFPKYYQPYETATADALKRSITLRDLNQKNPTAAKKVVEAMQEEHLEEATTRILPVHSRFGFWTALIDSSNAKPIKYLPIDLDEL